jgi:YVTN family beta-propeller protein
MSIGLAEAATEQESQTSEGNTMRALREGIAIDFGMEAVNPEKRSQNAFQEGDTVQFRFSFTDTTTGTPLSGVYPGAWMDFRPADEETNDEMCQLKVEAFVGGSLLAQPELDLNIYYVLALNNDPSITVVDPLFGFGNTKLLDMVMLKSPGEDWVLTPDQGTLFVSMPELDQVAVADTDSWNVVANLDVGPRPSRVALQPDARFLWVGYDEAEPGAGQSGVSVIDASEFTLVKHIPTGKGHHEIAFSDNDRYAFITNERSGTLSIIDIQSLEKIKDVPTGEKPVSVAFSSLSQTVYVVNQGDGSIVAVDAARHEVVARIEAEPGLGQIKFAPGDRLGFVVNPEHDLVHILDASLNRIIQTGDMEDEPEQIAFSDEALKANPSRPWILHPGS